MNFKTKIEAKYKIVTAGCGCEGKKDFFLEPHEKGSLDARNGGFEAPAEGKKKGCGCGGKCGGDCQCDKQG